MRNEVFPDAQLAVEHAEDSVLYKRVVFVLATPESGADLVARALGRLPGVTNAPVATNLFSMGMAGLLYSWIYGQDDERIYGLADLVDEQELLWHARRLGDELLAPLAGDPESVIVEYSPDHIRSADAISMVYPDALLLHIVRDGSDVVGRLSSRHRVVYWPRPAPLAHGAIEQWCEDQRALDEFDDAENYRVARIERILADPTAFLAWFAEGIGLDVDADDLLGAADALGSGEWELTHPRARRAQALLNIEGAELLDRYDYQPVDTGEALALAARVELGSHHVVERTRERLMSLSERLRELSVRWAEGESAE